jgi:hypothetical protein
MAHTRRVVRVAAIGHKPNKPLQATRETRAPERRRSVSTEEPDIPCLVMRICSEPDTSAEDNDETQISN